MAKQALGRGLSALLGEDTTGSDHNGDSNEIDIDLVGPNPEQPRTRFADVALDELAKSIVANGIVQPIVVRKAGARIR
jgi:ParB family chromosome partitioning protein